jgi:hypothetical protein
MSFWKTSAGESVAALRNASFDAGGGSMDPIPDNTSAVALIDEAKWETREGLEYISLRWSVLAPKQYENRKIYQKLWVSDADPSAKDADKKRDKALRMLAAIDTNAGGRLTRVDGKPDNVELSTALVSKPMMIKIMQWSIDDRQTGEKKTGNWIAAVSPKTSLEAAPQPAPQRVVISSTDGMDIPF